MTRIGRVNDSPVPALRNAGGLGGVGSPPLTAEEISAMGFVGPLLIADDHSTPLVFDDILQTEEGDDFLYADVGV